MSIPDYISPVVGYCVWTWGAAGLKSLCGEPWHPGRALAARCRASTVVGRSRIKDDIHDAPHADCTCGIYAAKTLHYFRSAGCERHGIHGEVCLWGMVIEHELGCRAQFAYPKNLVLPTDTLPFTVGAIQDRLRELVAYGIQIFVEDDNGKILWWTKHSGLNPTRLDYLNGMGKQYYGRSKSDRIRKGDRVAVLGRGTAVVEQVNAKWIRAVVLNKCTLSIALGCISWDRQNRRWETSPSACVETDGRAFCNHRD